MRWRNRSMHGARREKDSTLPCRCRKWGNRRSRWYTIGVSSLWYHAAVRQSFYFHSEGSSLEIVDWACWSATVGSLCGPINGKETVSKWRTSIGARSLEDLRDVNLMMFDSCSDDKDERWSSFTPIDQMINDRIKSIGAARIRKDESSRHSRARANLHDQDRPARLIVLNLASTKVTNDNFERRPIGPSPSLHASSIRRVDPKRKRIDGCALRQFRPLYTCPWPSEIVFRRFENFISSANLYKSAAGSVPTERTKINGVIADESRKTRWRSAV